MKKLIFLIILLAGVTLGQTKGKQVSDGTIWTDSLGFGTVATSDSVWIFNANFSHDWYRFVVEGNSNSPVDSVKVQAGTIRYTQAGVAVDTMWGSWATLKDSVWNDINTIVNNSVGRDFLLFNPVVQLLKLSLLNEWNVAVYNGADVTRNVTITIQAVK